VTFAFGGQRFDTEAFEPRRRYSPQDFAATDLCGGSSFILSFFHLETAAKQLISLEGILSFFPNTL
jgi:hypothetical protein